VGFLAELCAAWEAAALGAEAHGVRVAVLRIGLVLGLDGGALSAMLPAFRAGAGGPLGDGRQVMPWIAQNDLLGIVLRGLHDDRMRGAFNATAPTPVDGRAFARALGAQLDRPARLRVPAFALRAVLGARAKAVLQSQRALPIALERLGHSFEHPRLETALAAVLSPLDEVSFARRSGAAVLETETVLDTPIERAFSFFCRAENLGLITPSFMRFEIVGSPPEPVVEGSVIDYRIRVGPVPLRWRTVIRRWSPPSGFVDEQERGPYALWQHEHILSAEGARTRMIDRVSYVVPLGAVGRLANVLVVQSTLRSIFAYRADAIRRLFSDVSVRGESVASRERRAPDP
jgi:ligand-binding SRPBCC domain-containing protein